MAALTTTSVGAAGILDFDGALTAAAGGGDTFTYTNRTSFIASNASGSPITITFTAQTLTTTKPLFGTVTKASFAMIVAAADRCISPFFEDVFKDTSGNVSVTYSDVTTLTVGAISFPELTR